MDEAKRQQFVKIIEDFTGMCGIYLPMIISVLM